MTIEEIAPGLVRDPAGYWLTPEQAATISWPADGNDTCLAMEEESFWFAHRNRAIVAAVRRYPPDGPIFDVGSGNGYVAAALEKAGFPTIAIEPSRAGASNAMARHVANVVCGVFPSTAFLRPAAGAVALFDVLEHVEDDRAFLESLRPWLRGAGRLYLTVPAYRWLWSDNDVRSGHHRRYTIPSLAATVTRAGFRIDFATYLFWFLPLPILLFRVLGKNSSASRARRQHAAGGAALRRMAEAFLAPEMAFVRRGMRVPFGGSCLVIASLA